MLTLFIVLTVSASGLHAETLYIKKPDTQLRATASGRADVVHTLEAGTAVEVLDKKGKFYQVSGPGGAKGWVFKFKLTGKKPGKEGGGLFGAFGGGQDYAATESASASSIRGLSPISEEYGKRKGLSEKDIEAVKQMENFKVSREELEAFLSSRKLGEFSQ